MHNDGWRLGIQILTRFFVYGNTNPFDAYFAAAHATVRPGRPAPPYDGITGASDPPSGCVSVGCGNRRRSASDERAATSPVVQPGWPACAIPPGWQCMQPGRVGFLLRVGRQHASWLHARTCVATSTVRAVLFRVAPPKAASSCLLRPLTRIGAASLL